MLNLKLTKSQWVGIALMAPAIILVAYLILSPKMWMLAIVNIVSTLMAMVGWNMFKGLSTKDAIKDVVSDVKNEIDSLTK